MTSSAEPAPSWLPEVGGIYRVDVTWRLIDHSIRQEGREILVLDAYADSRGVHIVWRMMEGTGDDYLPEGSPTRASFPYWTPNPEVVVWRSEEPTYALNLLQQVGTYKPRDPEGNSVEILREYALQQLDVIAREKARGRS